MPPVPSAAGARPFVDWWRCHPVGRRPLDGGNTDGKFCLIPITEYARHTNEERVVVLQIESPEALEQVEEIAAVPGFDGLMFGPGDFSHRIGKVGQIDAPEVVAARRRVAAAARRHGKFTMSSGLFQPFSDLIEEGTRVFNIGADVLALGAYVKQRLEVVRGHVESLPHGLKPGPRSPYGG